MSRTDAIEAFERLPLPDTNERFALVEKTRDVNMVEDSHTPATDQPG